MSLKHLYRDLSNLGVYPDISKSNNREKFITHHEVKCAHNTMAIEVGRYYTCVFYMKWNWFIDWYIISICINNRIIGRCNYSSHNKSMEIIIRENRMLIKNIQEKAGEKMYETLVDVILDKLS